MSQEKGENVPRNQEMSQEKPFELNDEDMKISLNGTLSTQKQI